MMSSGRAHKRTDEGGLCHVPYQTKSPVTYIYC